LKPDESSLGENAHDNTDNNNNLNSVQHQDQDKSHTDQSKSLSAARSLKPQPTNIVKIEDFLSVNTHAVKAEKQPPPTKLQPQQIAKPDKKQIILKNINKLPSEKAPKLISSPSSQDKLQKKKTTITPAEKTCVDGFEFMKNVSFMDDPPLNGDPKNVFK
jgi:hypothetical protein